MNTTQKIPVYAVGPSDYVTLIMPTIPHDYGGEFATAWDKFSGHGPASKQFAIEQGRADTLEAQELLETYCQWYDLDVNSYEIVSKWEASYDSDRRTEAKRELQSV